MKHVTYADKSLLLGDDTADTLIRYAAALTQHGTADSVEVKAISSDGDSVTATFLLGPGAPLMAETATNDLPEPDNSDVTTHMQERIGMLGSTPEGHPLDLEDQGGGYVEDYNPTDPAGLPTA